jgi:hypothetical protein
MKDPRGNRSCEKCDNFYWINTSTGLGRCHGSTPPWHEVRATDFCKEFESNIVAKVVKAAAAAKEEEEKK